MESLSTTSQSLYVEESRSAHEEEADQTISNRMLLKSETYNGADDDEISHVLHFVDDKESSEVHHFVDDEETSNVHHSVDDEDSSDVHHSVDDEEFFDVHHSVDDEGIYDVHHSVGTQIETINGFGYYVV